MVEYDRKVVKITYAVIGILIFIIITWKSILASIIGFIADNEKPEYVLTYYFGNSQSWKYTISFYKPPEEDNTYQFLSKLTNTEPTTNQNIDVIFQKLVEATVKTENEVVLDESYSTFIAVEQEHKEIINDFVKRTFKNGESNVTISSKDISKDDLNILLAITFNNEDFFNYINK